MNLSPEIIIGPGNAYWRKEGDFRVLSGSTIEIFSQLEKALLFQDSQPEESATWDVTDGASLVLYKDHTHGAGASA